eukprot:9272489-Prorocentrum_lima.AAC.1
MDNDEKELWIESIRAELKSFEDVEVFDEVIPEEVRAMRQRGSYPKKLPARLILVKNHVPNITTLGNQRQELCVV